MSFLQQKSIEPKLQNTNQSHENLFNGSNAATLNKLSENYGNT